MDLFTEILIDFVLIEFFAVIPLVAICCIKYLTENK